MKTIFTFFTTLMFLFLAMQAGAQSAYKITSSQGWSASLPSTCANCTITISTGATLTIDKDVSCQNCTIQGGAIVMSSQSLNIQYSGSLTTTYFKGTSLAVSGTGKLIVNAPLSLSNTIFTFTNSSSFSTSYQLDLDASRVNLYDNSTMVSTGGSSTMINLVSSSRIVIGNGSKTSNASFLVSGPTLSIYDKSGITLGNENNAYNNWANYIYSPNSHASNNAQKSYPTTNSLLNCGSGHANSCSNLSLYGPSTLSSAGPVSGNTLPVVITGFSAELNNDKTIGLVWNTSEETNSSHFDIERSLDGHDWNKIGSVQASMNSSTETGYSFTDENPAAGINYYRLSMVDLDGSSRYTDVRAVRSSVVASISFFPNPARDYINVSLGASAAGERTIRLLNQAGQVLQEKKVAAGGSIIVSLPVQQYHTGLYFLSVTGADGLQESSKLLISRS